MIEFENKLPSMNANGRENGTYNNYELVLPSVLTTKDARLGLFMHLLQNTIRDDRSLVFVDGKVLKVSKNWIRDYVHEMKGFKHWEYDLLSFLDFIIEKQRADGCYYELIKQLDDRHWAMVNEDCYILYPEDNVALVRLELEADIEYLVVEGAMQYYRATGDFERLVGWLPRLERGIEYITADPKRFDGKTGLVVRPYTIDTWDFTNDADSQNNRRIKPGKPVCAMHGDNSGVYQAMNQLALINEMLGNTEKAAEWKKRAAALRSNMFKYLWNGKFFIHQYLISGEEIDGKENIRLSLSNTYDMNRGVCDTPQCRSIINEYMERRKTAKSFAEWFSIDPPYEKFLGYTAGNYVNGAISPFAAGELAKAAFKNGYEAYGWDIISRFMKMAERDSSVYFLYSPEIELPQGGGPSAWGAAALLSAIDEGLAGIEDTSCLYNSIDFSPRFPVTDYTELRYFTGYEISDVFVQLRYILKENGMRYDLISPAKHVNAHILLPAGKKAKSVSLNGVKAEFSTSRVGDSEYVDLRVEGKETISFEITF